MPHRTSLGPLSKPSLPLPSAFAARGFPTRYGRGLVSSLVSRIDRYLVVAQPEHWERVKPALGNQPVLVVPPSELTETSLDSLARIVPEADAVIGVGGSAAIDSAKWLHWRRSLLLYLVPSMPSVDACFVRYVELGGGWGQGRSVEGAAVPEEVLVDFDLMWAAPPMLVRAGVGDVLACHTACFDWQLASDAGHGPTFDPEVADLVRSCLRELVELTPALAAGRDEGLRRLMECRRLLGWQRDRLDHRRFEEGSEHAFAVAMEEVTGRVLNHGELVALGVVLFSAIQNNQPELPLRIVTAGRLRADPVSLGLGWPEVVAALRHLPAVVAGRGLPWSSASEPDLSAAALGRAREAVRLAGIR